MYLLTMFLKQIFILFIFTRLYGCKAFDDHCEDLTHHANWHLLDPDGVCGNSVDPLVSPRILGGVFADLGEFPWMALLSISTADNSVISCGGFLISNRYVLTAAHCVINNADVDVGDDYSTALTPNQLRITLGEYDTRREEDCVSPFLCTRRLTVDSEEVIVHDGHNIINHDNDIALIRLSHAINFTDFIVPICLPINCTMMSRDFIGDSLTVAGWGNTIDVGIPQGTSILQKAKVRVFDSTLCDHLWTEVDSDWSSKVCAGGLSGKDACRGDSGGPLMYRARKGYFFRSYAIGIVSFGDLCYEFSTSMRPGVYTRVSSYVPWILDNMRP